MCLQQKLCCNCCHQPKAKQKCPIHTNQIFLYVCSTSQCLQLLCEKCLASHKQNHKTNKIGQSNLVQLRSAQNFYFESIQSGIKNIEDSKNNKNKQIGKPQQIIQNYIDEFIYGSLQRKQKLFKQNKAKVQDNYSSKVLIKLMEQDNQLKINSSFKQKYFKFLDKIVQQQISS